MSNRLNTAYDLSRFEPSKEIDRKPKPQIKKVARKKYSRTINPMRAIALLICIVSATAIILYTRAQITEVNSKINGITDEYAIAESEEIRLQMELEQMMSLQQISEYVKTNCGMVEAGKGHVKAFTLPQENRIEIKKDENLDFFQSIENFFSKVKEYITS